jgi:RNA polymerase sigma factor (sigma-70 family)
VSSPTLIGPPPLRRAEKPRRRFLRHQRGGEQLDADALRAMEHSVAEALRRQYGQSPGFAVDTAAEMVNEAFAEYAEQPEAERAKVRNLPGALVTRAIQRGLDKARKESREIRGESAQTIIDGAEDATPSTEALAVQGIEAAEVFEAVGELHHEQRRALIHLYWEGLTTRQAAERMGVGTMTVCRRRDDAMATLRARFGVSEGDPIEKHLGKQSGFAAWTILAIGPAAVHGVSAAGDQLAAGADTAHRGVDAVANAVSNFATRAKELAARTFSSSGGEQVGGAITNGTAGGLARTIGVCVAGGVAIYCGAGAVGVGPGVGLLDPGADNPSPAAIHRPAAQAPPARSIHRQPIERTPIEAPPSHVRNRDGERTRRQDRRRDRQGRVYRKSSERAVRSQSLESQATEPAPEPAPEPEPPYVGEADGGGESTASHAASGQFDLP